MRVGEVAGHEDELGPDLLQQRAHHRHVRRTDRILPHLAGLVERKVEKPGRPLVESECADSRHRLRLADDPLEVLHLRDVHVARVFSGEEVIQPAAQLGDALLVEPALPRQAADEVGVPAHVVVEHREVAAGHVGDGDRVPVEGQLGEDPAHRDHVVVGMGREADDPLAMG